MNAPFNAPVQVRQLAQYGRADAAIPGTVTLMQMGEAGTPYASILTRDLVTSALAGGGDFNLAAGSGSINFLFDQGAGAVTLSVSQGELLVSTALRTSMLNATFVNAQSVTQNGVPVATQCDLRAITASSVTSFNGRTGDILLEDVDILRAGGAPQDSPHFTGWVTAPSSWDTRQSDDTVATTNWVHRVLCTGFYTVKSFNGRTGDITLTTSDINAAYAVPGVYPTAPSPTLGDASTRIATTAFVDESLEGYITTYSPALTGVPTAPTAAPGNVSNQIATTAFVAQSEGAYLPLTGGTLTGSLNMSAGTYQYAGKSLAYVVPAAVDNVFLGEAGNVAVTGSGNIGIGPNALSALTTGSNNVYVGAGGGVITTGSNNTVVGGGIPGLTSALSNALVLGAGSAVVSTVAGTITYFGSGAGNLATAATHNTGVGYHALNAVTTGGSNTAIGDSALLALTTATFNTAVGINALKSANSAGNSVVGYNAGQALTSGASNNAIGFSALAAETTGSNCVAIGYQALSVQNGSGGNNIAIGYTTGGDVTTGAGNTLVGHNVGRGLTTGGQNTIVGYNITGIPAATASCLILGAGSNTILYDYNYTTPAIHTISAAVRLSKGYTVATLPSGKPVGTTAYVTDGTAALAWGVTVTGGGSTPYLVWYNGTAWTVVGK